MSTTRVIKKYPNRRLYDTETSRYITLSDVRELVIDRIDFQVIDKKTGEDITRTILLQVISEQEQHGDGDRESVGRAGQRPAHRPPRHLAEQRDAVVRRSGQDRRAAASRE